MTAPRCSICARPDRSAIDHALADGRPLRTLAKRFGTTDSTLDRHKQHVNAKREERAPVAPPPASILASSLPVVPMTTAQLISGLEMTMQHQYEQLEHDTSLSVHERTKLQNTILNGLDRLAKLQGRIEINERRIMATPAMRRIQDRILELLLPYPEVLHKVGVGLQKLGEEQGL